MKTTAFKNTDIGPIPEDWGTSPIGVICDIQLGKMLDEEKNIGEPKPYLGNRAVQWNRIVLDSISTIRLTPEEQKRYLLQDGDLLVCEGGEVGRSAIWRTDLPECYYQKALHRLRSKNGNTICIEFLLQLFHLYSTSGIFESSVTKTSIAHLPKDKLENILVPLPPLPEQRRIAAALSDADELVASLDKLIEKKKRVKEGAMQRLLSGETRLPGFTGKWVEKSVEEIIDKISTGLNPRQNFVLNNGGSNYYVTIKDFKDGELDFSGCDKIDDAALQLINARSDLRVGDILFSSIGRIGDAYVVKETPTNWNVNESVFVLHPANGFDSMFLYYLIKSEAFQKDLKESSTGTTMTGIKVGHLEKIVCTLPIDCEEQCSIAAVLSDMDAEIAALSRERAEAERIKQGMMQELLTGKTRLAEGE